MRAPALALESRVVADSGHVGGWTPSPTTYSKYHETLNPPGWPRMRYFHHLLMIIRQEHTKDQGEPPKEGLSAPLDWVCRETLRSKGTDYDTDRREQAPHIR